MIIIHNHKGKNNPAYDHTIYKFKNKNTREIYKGTAYDFTHKYGLDRCSISKMVHGRSYSHRKWICLGIEK